MCDGQALLLTIALAEVGVLKVLFTVVITMVAKYLIFTLGINETFTG